MLATYADAWTAQLFVLADYYNVAAEAPEFTEQYTNNEAKYASTPAALKGFERLAEGAEKGWYQPDYLSTTHADGLGMLAAWRGRPVSDAQRRRSGHRGRQPRRR